MTDFIELYERLKEDRSQLSEELEQIRAKLRPVSGRREGSPFGKREEEADGAFELEKGLALEKRLTDALIEVEHAMKKYESGTYGVCDLCGQLIAPARLEALPQANLCLDCKARQTKDARSKTARAAINFLDISMPLRSQLCTFFCVRRANHSFAGIDLNHWSKRFNMRHS